MIIFVKLYLLRSIIIDLKQESHGSIKEQLLRYYTVQPIKTYTPVNTLEKQNSFNITNLP